MKLVFRTVADKIAAETIANLNNNKKRHWYIPKSIIASIYTTGYMAGANNTGAVFEDVIEQCVWDADDIERINRVNEIIRLETMWIKSK